MTYEDFYPSFARARAIYEKEYPAGSTKPWPYTVGPEEESIKRLLKEVVDPSTNEYYKSETGELPKKEIHQIVRIRTLEGKEYVYSNGSVKFYNMYHDPTVRACNRQEAYPHANFTHKTMPDPKDGHNKRFTTGIESTIIKYDLEWNGENIDKLVKLQSPTGYKLTLWDERSSPPGIEPSDLNMFKTKPFDYIFKGEYLTPEQKDLAIREHEAMSGTKVETTTKKR